MSAVQTRLSYAGVSKQPTKGTAVTPPAYGFGLRSGVVLSSALDQARDEITTGAFIAPQAIRAGVVHGAAFQTRAWTKLLPLFAYAALGAINSSGTGPTTHTVTPGTGVLPRLTFSGRYDALYTQLVDAFVDELTIGWDKRNAVDVDVKLVATILTILGSSWTPTTDMVGETYLAPPAGTFKLDAGSATPVVAPITGGSFKISNNHQPVELSTSIEPDDWVRGEQVIDIELMIKPTDMAEWRKIITGTSGGTAVQQTPVYGSTDCLFTIDANNSLQLVAPRVAFTADFPDVNPAGGGAEVKLTGQLVRPTAGGAEFTITGKNSITSY